MVGERKRGGWKVPLAGLAGFALGAATVLLIVWLYGKSEAPRMEAPPAATPSAAQPSSTAQPPPSQTAPAPPAATPPVLAPPPAAIPPADLAQRDLLLPVQGIRREELRDTFNEARSQGRVHEAIDIIAPRNTPVLAVEAGRIVKFFSSNLGGLTIYQFDPTETYCYYYAHLDHYAPGLKEGDQVAKGQVIAFVGSTGDASPDAPHLHFEITRLHADKHWWQGDSINPYPVLREGR
ncbi:MAG TPA: M23 family metallopeptidase [Thermoanaerobaculia bacterium]